jgi:CBS domain-containing protein
MGQDFSATAHQPYRRLNKTGTQPIVVAFLSAMPDSAPPTAFSVRYRETDMKVKQAMHKGAVWVDPSTPLNEIAKTMRKNDIGALPVGENDRLVGMVTDRDIVCRGLADGRDFGKLTARDVMTAGIAYCTEAEDVEDALRIMETKKIRRLPVINDKKRLVGMLSLGDISHACPNNLTGEVVKAIAEHHK